MKIKSRLSFLAVSAFVFTCLCVQSTVFGCDVCGGKKDKEIVPDLIPRQDRG